MVDNSDYLNIFVEKSSARQPSQLLSEMNNIH